MGKITILEGSQVLREIKGDLQSAILIRVVTPYLTLAGARLFTSVLKTHKYQSNRKIEFLVRFDERSVGSLFCDPAALELLKQECLNKGYGFEAKQLPSVHAKMILTTREKTGSRKDVIGSANVTYKGLSEFGNKEACVIVKGSDCQRNDEIWSKWYRMGLRITNNMIKQWKKNLPDLRKTYGFVFNPSLRACVIKGQNHDYIKSLKWILTKADTKRGLPVKKLIDNMDVDPDVDKKHTPTNALAKFLHYLGMIELEDDVVRISELGEIVLEDIINTKYAQLEIILRERYPQIDVFWNSLSSRVFQTYNEVVDNIKSSHNRTLFRKGKNLLFTNLSPVKQWLKFIGKIDERKAVGKKAKLEFKRKVIK